MPSMSRRRSFGVGLVEMRGLWNKNVVNLDEKEVAEAQKLLKKYDLKVTDIASPLFKVDWPGAPKSKYSPKGDSLWRKRFPLRSRMKCSNARRTMAHAFGTNRFGSSISGAWKTTSPTARIWTKSCAKFPARQRSKASF